MKILARWTKLNQIMYTYSVGTLKTRNAKKNTQKGGGAKIKILALWTNQRFSQSLQKAEKSQPKHSVKKQAKFEKSSENYCAAKLNSPRIIKLRKQQISQLKYSLTWLHIRFHYFFELGLIFHRMFWLRQQYFWLRVKSIISIKQVFRNFQVCRL